MRRFLGTVFRPECFHGHGRRRRPFFEGWYFKLVDAEQARSVAVIPGLFLGSEPGDDHAFVQILDGRRGQSHYFRYPAESFSAAERAFDLRVGPSRFGPEEIELDASDEKAHVRGRVAFGPFVPWPVRPLSPGVMGPYGWLPFLECYHGVLSFDHALEGALALHGGPFADETVELGGGRGYCEKDWGEAFPSAYVWMQTNHFEAADASLTASVAMIPWRRSAFRGFLVGLRHAGRLHRFASYTGARIEALAVDDAVVEWRVADRWRRLALRAHRAEGGLLHAPVRTQMDRRVDETLRARVEVELTDRRGRTLFHGTGHSAGLEVQGDLPTLLAAQ